MLAHQIDDENVQRYRRKSRFAQYGPLRITMLDAQPHPNPNCLGWAWAPDRDTFADPYGMTQNPCRVEHSLFPQGDGVGTTLQIGWAYLAGTTVAVGAAGPHLADVSTTFLAETLPWPATLGPADRPDFSQALYRPLAWRGGRTGAGFGRMLSRRLGAAGRRAKGIALLHAQRNQRSDTLGDGGWGARPDPRPTSPPRRMAPSRGEVRRANSVCDTPTCWAAAPNDMLPCV